MTAQIADSGKPRADAFQKVRQSRRLSIAEAARETGISSAELSAIESGDKAPSRGTVKALAKLYSVPAYFFYIEDLRPTEITLPDFRSPETQIAKLYGSLAASVTRANEIRDVIAEGWEYVIEPKKGWLRIPNLAVDEDIRNAAKKLRNYFLLDEKPADTFESTKSYLDWLRARAESGGLITIFETLDEDDGRGYCITHDNRIPYISLNTLNQGQESRIFTLIHELAHVGLRASGVSDPFATRNTVERFCNRVTAETLMPSKTFIAAADRFSSIKIENLFVKSLAEAFKVSQQAAALRSEETGVKPKGFYAKWLSQFTKDRYRQVNVNFESPIRISKDQGKRKIAKYGTTLPRIFSQLLDRRFISALDVRRLSGIKPKYLELTEKAATQRLMDLGLNGG